MKAILALVPVALLGLASPALAAAYDIDPNHSVVDFSVKHMMVSSVRGEFGGVSGAVSYDAAHPEKSVVDVVIDVTTLNTRVAKRDGHLKSPDFLDVEKYPQATFKSTKVKAAGKGKLKVMGNFTLHGVTRPLTLEVSDLTPETRNPWGQLVVGAHATTRLNRKDFGLVWNKQLDGGGYLVGDDVTLNIDVELDKKAAAPESAPGTK